MLLLMSESPQLNSALLRAKFGEPVNREIFSTPQGIELSVQYGANGEVCRLEIPADQESEAREFIEDLVPLSMRGKELNRSHKVIGAFSVSLIIYERVIVWETEVSGRRKQLIVEFKEGRTP
jgi:hypothetical protein